MSDGEHDVNVALERGKSKKKRQKVRHHADGSSERASKASAKPTLGNEPEIEMAAVNPDTAGRKRGRCRSIGHQGSRLPESNTCRRRRSSRIADEDVENEPEPVDTLSRKRSRSAFDGRYVVPSFGGAVVLAANDDPMVLVGKSLLRSRQSLFDRVKDEGFQAGGVINTKRLEEEAGAWANLYGQLPKSKVIERVDDDYLVTSSNGDAYKMVEGNSTEGQEPPEAEDRSKSKLESVNNKEGKGKTKRKKKKNKKRARSEPPNPPITASEEEVKLVSNEAESPQSPPPLNTAKIEAPEMTQYNNLEVQVQHVDRAAPSTPPPLPSFPEDTEIPIVVAEEEEEAISVALVANKHELESKKKSKKEGRVDKKKTKGEVSPSSCEACVSCHKNPACEERNRAKEKKCTILLSKPCRPCRKRGKSAPGSLSEFAKSLGKKLFDIGKNNKSKYNVPSMQPLWVPDIGFGKEWILGESEEVEESAAGPSGRPTEVKGRKAAGSPLVDHDDTSATSLSDDGRRHAYDVKSTQTSFIVNESGEMSPCEIGSGRWKAYSLKTKIQCPKEIVTLNVQECRKYNSETNESTCESGEPDRWQMHWKTQHDFGESEPEQAIQDDEFDHSELMREKERQYSERSNGQVKKKSVTEEVKPVKRKRQAEEEAPQPPATSESEVTAGQAEEPQYEQIQSTSLEDETSKEHTYTASPARDYAPEEYERQDEQAFSTCEEEEVEEQENCIDSQDDVHQQRKCSGRNIVLVTKSLSRTSVSTVCSDGSKVNVVVNKQQMRDPGEWHRNDMAHRNCPEIGNRPATDVSGTEEDEEVEAARHRDISWSNVVSPHSPEYWRDDKNSPRNCAKKTRKEGSSRKKLYEEDEEDLSLCVERSSATSPVYKQSRKEKFKENDEDYRSQSPLKFNRVHTRFPINGPDYEFDDAPRMKRPKSNETENQEQNRAHHKRKDPNNNVVRNSEETLSGRNGYRFQKSFLRQELSDDEPDMIEEKSSRASRHSSKSHGFPKEQQRRERVLKEDLIETKTTEIGQDRKGRYIYRSKDRHREVLDNEGRSTVVAIQKGNVKMFTSPTGVDPRGDDRKNSGKKCSHTSGSRDRRHGREIERCRKQPVEYSYGRNQSCARRDSSELTVSGDDPVVAKKCQRKVTCIHLKISHPQPLPAGQFPDERYPEDSFHSGDKHKEKSVLLRDPRNSSLPPDYRTYPERQNQHRRPDGVCRKWIDAAKRCYKQERSDRVSCTDTTDTFRDVFTPEQPYNIPSENKRMWSSYQLSGGEHTSANTRVNEDKSKSPNLQNRMCDDNGISSLSFTGDESQSNFHSYQRFSVSSAFQEGTLSAISFASSSPVFKNHSHLDFEDDPQRNTWSNETELSTNQNSSSGVNGTEITSFSYQQGMIDILKVDDTAPFSKIKSLGTSRFNTNENLLADYSERTTDYILHRVRSIPSLVSIHGEPLDAFEQISKNSFQALSFAAAMGKLNNFQLPSASLAASDSENELLRDQPNNSSHSDKSSKNKPPIGTTESLLGHGRNTFFSGFDGSSHRGKRETTESLGPRLPCAPRCKFKERPSTFEIKHKSKKIGLEKEQSKYFKKENNPGTEMLSDLEKGPRSELEGIPISTPSKQLCKLQSNMSSNVDSGCLASEHQLEVKLPCDDKTQDTKEEERPMQSTEMSTENTEVRQFDNGGKVTEKRKPQICFSGKTSSSKSFGDFSTKTQEQKTVSSKSQETEEYIRSSNKSLDLQAVYSHGPLGQSCGGLSVSSDRQTTDNEESPKDDISLSDTVTVFCITKDESIRKTSSQAMQKVMNALQKSVPCTTLFDASNSCATNCKRKKLVGETDFGSDSDALTNAGEYNTLKSPEKNEKCGLCFRHPIKQLRENSLKKEANNVHQVEQFRTNDTGTSSTTVTEACTETCTEETKASNKSVLSKTFVDVADRISRSLLKSQNLERSRESKSIDGMNISAPAKIQTLQSELSEKNEETQSSLLKWLKNSIFHEQKALFQETLTNAVGPGVSKILHHVSDSFQNNDILPGWSPAGDAASEMGNKSEEDSSGCKCCKSPRKGSSETKPSLAHGDSHLLNSTCKDNKRYCMQKEIKTSADPSARGRSNLLEENSPKTNNPLDHTSSLSTMEQDNSLCHSNTPSVHFNMQQTSRKYSVDLNDEHASRKHTQGLAKDLCSQATMQEYLRTSATSGVHLNSENGNLSSCIKNTYLLPSKEDACHVSDVTEEKGQAPLRRHCQCGNKLCSRKFEVQHSTDDLRSSDEHNDYCQEASTTHPILCRSACAPNAKQQINSNYSRMSRSASSYRPYSTELPAFKSNFMKSHFGRNLYSVDAENHTVLYTPSTQLYINPKNTHLELCNAIPIKSAPILEQRYSCFGNKCLYPGDPSMHACCKSQSARTSHDTLCSSFSCLENETFLCSTCNCCTDFSFADTLHQDLVSWNKNASANNGDDDDSSSSDDCMMAAKGAPGGKPLGNFKEKGKVTSSTIMNNMKTSWLPSFSKIASKCGVPMEPTNVDSDTSQWQTMSEGCSSKKPTTRKYSGSTTTGNIFTHYLFSNGVAAFAGRNTNGSGNLVASEKPAQDEHRSIFYPFKARDEQGDSEEDYLSATEDFTQAISGDNLMKGRPSASSSIQTCRTERDGTCNHPEAAYYYIGDGKHRSFQEAPKEDILMNISPCFGVESDPDTPGCKYHKLYKPDDYTMVKASGSGMEMELNLHEARLAHLDAQLRSRQEEVNPYRLGRPSYCGQGDTQNSKNLFFTQWYVDGEEDDPGVATDTCLLKRSRNLEKEGVVDNRESRSGTHQQRIDIARIMKAGIDKGGLESRLNVVGNMNNDAKTVLRRGVKPTESLSQRIHRPGQKDSNVTEVGAIEELDGEEEENDDEGDGGSKRLGREDLGVERMDNKDSDYSCEGDDDSAEGKDGSPEFELQRHSLLEMANGLQDFEKICDETRSEQCTYERRLRENALTDRTGSKARRTQLGKPRFGTRTNHGPVGQKFNAASSNLKHRQQQQQQQNQHQCRQNQWNRGHNVRQPGNLPSKRFSFDHIKVPSIQKERVRFACDQNGDWAEIGRGSYGCVYLGLLDGSMEVAIKDFYESSSWDLVIHEARMLLYLQTTGITPKFYGLRRRFNATKDPSEYCIIMEYFGDGRTLFNVMSDKISLSRDDWMDVVGQLVAGLRLIHRKNVLINDLKADNILIDLSPGRKLIRYIDVGMATYNHGLTFQLPQDQMNKYNFLAPEVRGGAHTSTKSDIYSLGYMLEQICRLADGTLGGLDRLVSRCMDKNPDHRPSIDTIVSHVHRYISVKASSRPVGHRREVLITNSI